MADDPFDTFPDADPAEIVTRKRSRFAEKPVDPLGDSSKKPKKVNLNPFQTRWFQKGDWTWVKVEHRNAYGSVSVDLWGFADFLAVRPGCILLVQTTSLPNAAARLRKAEGRPELRAWLAAGGAFEVHGWSKPANRWEVRRTAVELRGGALVRVVVSEEANG